MRELIKMKSRVSKIKHRTVYTARDLDDFHEKTIVPRKYFFRNVYLIQENVSKPGTMIEYLELRTFRKVYRYYF